MGLKDRSLEISRIELRLDVIHLSLQLQFLTGFKLDFRRLKEEEELKRLAKEELKKELAKEQEEARIELARANQKRERVLNKMAEIEKRRAKENLKVLEKLSLQFLIL